jgi:phosphatidylglycerophosphatase A
VSDAPPTVGTSSPQREPLWATLVATWFGAGLSPKAPGTVGSIASLVLWAPLVVLDVAWWIRVAVTLAVFAVGTLAAHAVVKARKMEDPQLVVVDEVAGMGVALTLSHHAWISVALGLAFFRLFDIWKPWPVRVADKNVHGGFGVMLDDILAGLYALGFVLVVEHYVLPHVLKSTEIAL